MSLPIADKSLNLDIRNFFSEFAKFILEFNKIVLDWITSRVVRLFPDSYSKVIPSLAISAALTCDLIDVNKLFEDEIFFKYLKKHVDVFPNDNSTLERGCTTHVSVIDKNLNYFLL